MKGSQSFPAKKKAVDFAAASLLGIVMTVQPSLWQDSLMWRTLQDLQENICVMNTVFSIKIPIFHETYIDEFRNGL